ncbi:ORF64 [Alphabaculovirus altermyunipunctae]|uniref:ORF64 n=1 Tax=Mythimna unipuncta nucleopolyhedrovirus TaxID=447897 RepID=A0A346TPK1_9ABAC|nr:ORF64 [Mythimna unipuncta nucleopolyhedrovirus]AXU41511.1 ORF64 [Mythimna unipuncta nucleopolyhedrovirus]
MNLLELSFVATSVSPLTVVLDNRVDRITCSVKKHLNIQTMGYTDELEFAKYYLKIHCKKCDDKRQSKFFVIVLNCYDCSSMVKSSPKCANCNKSLHMCPAFYF